MAQLCPFTEPRSSGFSLSIAGDGPLNAALAQADAERLIWRLLATLAGAASPGELLLLRGERLGGTARLTLQLPASLAALNSDQLMQATASGAPRAVMAGMFGTGFSLRLAAAEAQAAGGTLEQLGKALQLTLPGLTAAMPGHSEAEGKLLAT